MKAPNVYEWIEKTGGDKAAAAWVAGCNSLRNPWVLPDTQYRWGVNIVNRGGFPQTRPGFYCRLTLPSGTVQGLTFFRSNKDTSNQKEYLIAAVSGSVYAIPFPLIQPNTWESYRLKNIAFDPNAKNVYWAFCQKSASNTSGNLQIVNTYNILIMQDGVSNAAFFDGIDDAHVDPNPETYGTPTGKWMAWSGSRLWVARDNIVLASDLADPLSFRERITGTARGDFQFERSITGLANSIGNNRAAVLYVFTDEQTNIIQSNITDRTQWATTTGFVSLLYPSIGCVAGRSIVNHSGLLWWYAYGGLVATDSAAAAFLTSKVNFKDMEMAQSKRNFAPDISGICGLSFESYLMMSVPSGDLLNAHTMVLDNSIEQELSQDYAPPAWQGVWTGIRPVEWCKGIVDSERRCFCASVDYQSLPGETSFNHIWEAFQSDRTDTIEYFDTNGTKQIQHNPIYCSFETKLFGDTMDIKKFNYAELDLVECAGTVNVKVSYAGTKGAYKQILSKTIVATMDNTDSSIQEVTDIYNAVGEFRPQSRRIRTVVPDSQPHQCDSVESRYDETIDRAFGLYVQWCGRMAIDCLRLYLDSWQEPFTGECEDIETGARILTPGGKSFKFVE